MTANRRSPFGTVLRQFREASGLSQEQLAVHAGLSLRGVSDLERGLRATPRGETVRMLADALGLDEAQRTELLAARNARQDLRHAQNPHRIAALPVLATSFIGRVEEIEVIVNILGNESARLITLTGPGGVGKTRIAIEVARQLAESYANGAVFVNLSPVRNSELVIAAIADQLGIPAQVDREIREVLAIALQGRSMLMVLDNLEQVIEAAADIAWLLAKCPDLTILATSRELLRLAAEHVVPIDPMALPTYHDVYSLHRVDAVALFVARARAVDHNFSITQENAPTIAAIVNKLQGMPLAIELAAARLRLLTITDLLRRLDTQLPVLAGGVRDAPDRHRTMRDTIAWSYDLLSSTEQAVFRTLAIFPDGCMLETAVAVMECNGRLAEVEAQAAVEALVDSSLLRKREAADGHVRFRMLQIVREYGLEQLSATGEDIVSRRAAHDAWCTPLVRRAEFLMAEPDEVYWLNRTSAEYQNLREHLSWLLSNDYVEDALYVSGSLSLFRVLRWHMEEGKQELESLLAHPQVQRPTIARMKGCIGLGLICDQQGDFARALEVSRAGLKLARELGNERDLAWALNVTSIAHFYNGQIDEAESLYNEEAIVASSVQDSFFIQCTMHGQAAIADHRGHHDESQQLLQDVLDQCQSAGHVWGAALCKHNLGFQCIRRGELEEAERLVQEAQQGFAEIEGRGGSPGLFLTLADIARLRNDHARAAQMLESALDLARELGSIHDIAYSQIGLARISTDGGDLVAAQEHTYNAIQWYERSGSAIEAVRCLDLLTDIALADNMSARAAWCIGAVDGVLEKHGMHRTEIEDGEYQSRIERAIAKLGEREWRQHYERGHSSTIEDILAEVSSWQECQ